MSHLSQYRNNILVSSDQIIFPWLRELLMQKGDSLQFCNLDILLCWLLGFFFLPFRFCVGEVRNFSNLFWSSEKRVSPFCNSQLLLKSLSGIAHLVRIVLVMFASNTGTFVCCLAGILAKDGEDEFREFKDSEENNNGFTEYTLMLSRALWVIIADESDDRAPGSTKSIIWININATSQNIATCVIKCCLSLSRCSLDFWEDTALAGRIRKIRQLLTVNIVGHVFPLTQIQKHYFVLSGIFDHFVQKSRRLQQRGSVFRNSSFPHRYQ